MRHGTRIGLALGLAPLSLSAADFDGAKPLLCASTEVMECVVDAGCEKVTAESIGVATFVEIDFGAGSVTDAGSGMRTSTIENTDHIDGKLILQGAEDGIEGVRDGVGWSAAIDEDTGKLVVSASGDQAAFVIFGACVVR
jgi:hypothetical protein